jgi:predicted HicB family RNase H-like nuclease
MKQINVRIPDELHRAVKMKAASQGRSMAEIIKEFLEQWVKDDADDTERDTRGNQDRPAP